MSLISTVSLDSFNLSLLFKYRWFTAIALFWATLNSYTRIYLGVHFISDIIAGIIVGSLLAIIFYSVLILVKKPLLKTTSEISNKVIYSTNNGKILSIFILIYIIMLVCFSSLLSTLPH